MGKWSTIKGIWISAILWSPGSIISDIINFIIQPKFNTLEEICDNGMDDDGDGLVDLNDPECTCELFKPTSVIPNPSFEALNCCPSGLAQLFCAMDWIQASDPTSDLINSCNWMGFLEFPPPQPFPDGNGILGFRDGRVVSDRPERNWKEYAGACLLSPLIAGNHYRFEFYVGFVNSEISPPINLSFFGSTDCVNLPFGKGNAAFGCPTNGPGWSLLKSTHVASSGSGKWVKASIDIVVEEDIHAIVIGPGCLEVNYPISTYYYFDNLVLADSRFFDFNIREVNHPCDKDFKLSVPAIEGLELQWYKNGITLMGENSAELSKIYGDGSYQVRIMEGNSCRLTDAFEFSRPIMNEFEYAAACKNEGFQFGTRLLNQSGTYEETFISVNGCDSMVTLDLKMLGDIFDTIEASIFEGEEYEIGPFSFKEEGDHEARFTSSMGCDSLVLVQLEHYKIYFPNVFSPNGDGFNDEFRVSASQDLLKESILTIYDRWGGVVSEGEVWDGKANGRDVIPGVYTYVAIVRLHDGAERFYTGAVTVLH